MDNVEARAVVKYFCKKGMSPTEFHDDSVKTLGDEPPSYSMVKKWSAKFRRGRESMEDYIRSGCPKETTTDENIELLHCLIMCDRSLLDIARQIDTSFGAVQ